MSHDSSLMNNKHANGGMCVCCNCMCRCVCHAMHNYASLGNFAAKFLFDVGLEHTCLLEECNTLLVSEREQLNIVCALRIIM